VTLSEGDKVEIVRPMGGGASWPAAVGRRAR